MDKSIRPIFKNSFSSIKSDKNTLEQDKETLLLLASQQKSRIKSLQDVGYSDEAIEHEIDILNEISDVFEQIDSAIYCIDEAIKKMENIKKM